MGLIRTRATPGRSGDGTRDTRFPTEAATLAIAGPPPKLTESAPPNDRKKKGEWSSKQARLGNNGAMPANVRFLKRPFPRLATMSAKCVPGSENYCGALPTQIAPN